MLFGVCGVVLATGCLLLVVLCVMCVGDVRRLIVAVGCLWFAAGHDY